MKTKFRILTVFFSLSLIGAFGFLCYFFDYQVLYKDYPANTASLIAIPFLNIILFAGIISILWLTKKVTIKESEIIVNYIFRRKQIIYQTKDLIGFYWDTIPSGISYKRITLKFKNDRKVRFSDFETGNFYKTQDYIKSKFKICTKDGKLANSEQILDAYNQSDKIDRDQILSIRFIIIILWAIIGFSFVMLIKANNDNSYISIPHLFILLIILMVLVLSIAKFYSENRRSKKIKDAHNKPAPSR